MAPAINTPARTALAITVAGVAIAACGGSSSPSSPSSQSSSTVQGIPVPTPLAIQNAVLQVGDFTSGAKAGSTSNVPDLTSVKCTPDQSSGLQKQYKSDVIAASGREYGNVVAVFDGAADAQAFITQFFSDAKSCSDAASAPTPDNFGTYSFGLSITGSPSNLNIEAVQVNQYVTVLIQYVPQGAQPNQQSLRDLSQTSVNKLSRVGS